MRRGLCYSCYNDRRIRERYAPLKLGRKRGPTYRERGMVPPLPIRELLQDYDATL